MHKSLKNKSAEMMTSATHPLRVDFVEIANYPILSRLGITFAPGKKQANAVSGSWNRDLTADVERLREFYKADVLVSLIEKHEASELGIEHLASECRQKSIELIRFPLKDVSVPSSPTDFAGLIAQIVKILKQKKVVVIHCKGGLGRAGMTAACAAIAATDNNLSASEAVAAIRASRSPSAIETAEQENFVGSFGELWKQLAKDDARMPKNNALTKSNHIEFQDFWNTEPDAAETLDAEKLKRFQGCLLGGAVGDALGAAIEFDSIDQIRRKFGEQGLTDFAPAYGRIGAITDDTQMTLFTAEGLLRAETRGRHRGICNPQMVMRFAYLRWLETQGVRLPEAEVESMVYKVQSWLRDLPELNSRRAPGNSCLSALESGKVGTIKKPINNSKGCGGVMRVAPIGLAAANAFDSACEAAAITHGHPTGCLSAGVLALTIRQIVDGKSLSQAVNNSVYKILPTYAHHEETLAACDKAIKLARDANVLPTPETIETLGGGWIAEEALAISLYCSLCYENDFTKAVLLAVNHSGDSDSTGAITGNILGALGGVETIPTKWLAQLELKDQIAEIAEDLLIGFRPGDEWFNKYPGV